MFESGTPNKQTNVVVAPKNTEIVLVEGGDDPLSLVLPPEEDIAKIHEQRSRQRSLSEAFENSLKQVALAFSDQLESERAKMVRFQDSPIFLTRMSRLASKARLFGEEDLLVSEAFRLDPEDPFIAQLRADNLLSQGQSRDAEEIFSRLALGDDESAVLKLAAFAVRREDFESADRHVARALTIAPDSFSARLFEGGLALYRRDWERSIHSFRIAAEARPTSSVLFSNLAIAYTRTGQIEKAFSALKRAVSLGPLNQNAIFALADLAHREGRNDEAIPALRCLVSVEQNSAPAWSRLARALVQIGDYPDALDALRAEAGVAESSSVWNNLGVVYARSNNHEKALSSYKHAMKLASDSPDRGYFMAGINLAHYFSGAGSDRAFLDFTTELAQKAFIAGCVKDDLLSNAFVFYLMASARVKDIDAFAGEAEELINNRDASSSFVAWTLAFLFGRYGIDEEKRPKALALFRKYEGRIDALQLKDKSRAILLYNNLAFLFAEENDLRRAESYLRRALSTGLPDPYPIATLGLIDLRKGNVERGTSRYRRALSLVKTKGRRESIRQKLEVELGRYWLRIDADKAKKHLNRASGMRSDEPALKNLAKKLLKEIPADS